MIYKSKWDETWGVLCIIHKKDIGQQAIDGDSGVSSDAKVRTIDSLYQNSGINTILLSELFFWYKIFVLMGPKVRKNLESKEWGWSTYNSIKWKQKGGNL